MPSRNYLSLQTFRDFSAALAAKNYYKEKHEGRILSIVEQYKEMQKEAKKIT
jgi:hypothetical protein